MADYVPGPDGEFQVWQQQFLSVAGTAPANLGLTPADISAAATLQEAWETAYAALHPAQQAAKAAAAVRDAAREAYEAKLRELAQRVQKFPGTTNGDREELGITVPQERTPATVPTGRPLAEIEEVEGLTQVLRLTDTESGKKAKPAGVEFIEMYRKIVPAGQPAPTEPSELELVGVFTNTRIVQEFDGADACKTAYYSFRYGNVRGKGPWSQIASGTIAA